MEFIEILWRSDLYQQEVELRDKLLRAPLGMTFSTEDLEAEQHELHFGMIERDRLIACLVVVPLRSSHVKIRQMCVDDSYRKQGVGTLLLSITESELIERGIKSVELNARHIAVGFYEKLGYEKQGEEFIEVTVPHFTMTKRF